MVLYLCFYFKWFPYTIILPNKTVCYVQEPYHQTQNTHSASSWSVSSFASHRTWLSGATLQWSQEEPGEGGNGLRWWGGRTRGYCWSDLRSQVACAALHRSEVTLPVLAPVCVTEAAKCRLHFLVSLQMFLGPSLSHQKETREVGLPAGLTCASGISRKEWLSATTGGFCFLHDHLVHGWCPYRGWNPEWKDRAKFFRYFSRNILSIYKCMLM